MEYPKIEPIVIYKENYSSPPEVKIKNISKSPIEKKHVPVNQQQVLEQPHPKEIKQVQELQPVPEKNNRTNQETYFFSKPITAKPESWEQEINELEQFFKTIALPTQPVKLNQCSTIKDVSKFIESHFTYVKANNGNRTYLPYLYRLRELKQILL